MDDSEPKAVSKTDISTEQSAFIGLFHVFKRYRSITALEDISVHINENEFLFLSGPSGAGKTTLLKLLYMGEPVSEGEIIVDGLNLSRIPLRRVPWYRRKFGIIFQDFRLIPSKTVYDNIAIVAEAVGVKRKLLKKKVNSLLRTVGIEKKMKFYPPSLSGGEQQRVAVARALAGDPKIILADEPTGSLDNESADMIINLLKAFHARGGTVIIATHDTALIRNMGGRVILLNQGRLEISTIIPKCKR